MPSSDLQSPDHWEGKAQDRQVDEQIRNSVPSIELRLIDAGTVRNLLVPIIGHRIAFKNSDEQAYDKIACHDAFRRCQYVAVPTDNSENSMVQQDQRGLERHGSAEIENLNGHENLIIYSATLSKLKSSPNSASDLEEAHSGLLVDWPADTRRVLSKAIISGHQPIAEREAIVKDLVAC